MSASLRVGYVPLTDALPLFVAQRLGLYADHGLEVELVAMRSWAQMRDALVFGQIQAGHCLPGIPLASQAGLFGPQPELACALTLNHFGNGITVSRRLLDGARGQEGLSEALLHACAVARRQGRKLRFASVYPVSKHEFELRHWLHSVGLQPDSDVELVVIPPPLVNQALQDEQIAGFCVGEPWNALAVSRQLGQVVATSRSLGLPGTEKVLATRVDHLDTAVHHALIKSLLAACEWLGDPGNRRGAGPWLAQALDLPQDMLEPGLFEHASTQDDRYMDFAGINRPDRWHARWLVGQIEVSRNGARLGDAGQISRRAFRSDVYDQVIAADAA